MKRLLFVSRSIGACLSIIIALSFSPNAQAQLQYRVEYGNLPVGTTYLLVNRLVEVSDGTNTAKVVTGFYRLNGGPNRGFIYDHTTGVFTDVHSLLAIDESLRSSCTSINSLGIAVGYVNYGSLSQRAFWFDFSATNPSMHFLDEQFPELTLFENHFCREINSNGDMLIRCSVSGPPYTHFVVNPFANGGVGELIVLDMFFDVSGINDFGVVLGLNEFNTAVTYNALTDQTTTYQEIEIHSGSKGKINNFGEFCGNTYVVTSGNGKRNATKRYAARHDGTRITWTSNPIEVSSAGARSINDNGDVLFLTYVAEDIAWFHHSSLGQSFEVKTLADDPFFNTAQVWDAQLTNRDNSLTVPAPIINGRAIGANGEYRLYFLFPEEPPTTYTYSRTHSPSLAIPDNGTVTSSIDVDEHFVIADLNVTLTINHQRAQDMDVFLISPGPNEKRVELFTDVGGNGLNFVGTTLDSQATASITSGSAPFTGTYRPEESLSAFNDLSTEGIWKLEVFDDKATKTGTLLNWSFTVQVK